MMYIFSFFFFLGPCIPARHFVFTWIVQTLIIVYMDSVYGYVFMAMCMDVCLWVCMDVFLCVCFWLCVYGYGYVYGYWVSILREARFINIGAYLSLGPVSITIGTHSSTRPISANFGTYSSTRPISANFGTYSSTRPISTILGTYSFTRPIWMTLRIFPIFLRQKWKNLPQYVVSNKFF
jgi:hypothetical protein